MSLWRWRGRPIGRYVVQAIPVVLLAAVPLRIAAIAAHKPSEGKWPRGNVNRAAIVDHLESTPGKHLIIVQYSPTHDENAEWVYNLSNIDASRIVWARDMGNHDNQELLQYFSDRKAWRLEADETRTKLTPYAALH